MFISVLLIICSYNAAKMNVFKGAFSEHISQVASTTGNAEEPRFRIHYKPLSETVPPGSFEKAVNLSHNYHLTSCKFCSVLRQ